ncbi:hypothetical protein [Sphingomonas sp. LR55]|uniref:hypothetical protein n=1 Tax=Sphingomonas sp. LR55 TaxID=3050231 RepID=UPI002FE327DA
MLLIAFALRSPLFGNPVIHSDEQFYLLVGDRLLHGAWPFVDIFDRKPVGLFLIFAGIRSVGGNGIVMYQLAATLVAAGTAFLVGRIVHRLTAPDRPHAPDRPRAPVRPRDPLRRHPRQSSAPA